KPGAAGAVGAQSVAVAKPDGYTLLVALVSISSTPEVDKLFGRPAIYTRDQFVGIARLNADPPLLVVNEEYARKHGGTTLKELGYEVEYYVWTALFAPHGVPAPVVQTLRDATRKAVQDPELRASMEKAKTPIAYQDADEFKKFWDEDAQRIAAVIQKIGKVVEK